MPPSSFVNENSHSSNRNNPHNKYDNDNNDAVIDRENYSSHHHHHEQQLTTTKRPVPDPVIHFEIQIHSGDNLAAKDRNLLGRRTTSDPYVELYLEESKMWKTKTIPKTLCPVWNHEIFTIKVSIESLLTTHCGTRPRSKKNHPYFELRIFDEDDYSKNDHMGTIRIPVPISKNDLTNIRNGNYPCYNSDDDDTSSSHHSDTIDDNDHHPNMSMSDFRNKWFPVPPESAKNAKGKIKVSMKTFINGKTREEMKKVFVAQNKKGQSSKAKKPEKRLSILVLGAAGRTGLECIKKMSRHIEGPLVHAFTRENGTPLLDVDKERCASVFEGDATNEDDIKAAIKQSRAKIIVVCIGDNSSSSSRSTKRRSSLGTSSTSSTNGRRRGRSSSTPPKDSDATIKATTTKTTTTNNVRTECAQAIVNVLTPIVHKKKIQVLVLSRVVEDYHKTKNSGKKQQLQQIIEDHTKQNEVYQNSKIKDRVSIIRPYQVKDSSKAPTMKVRVFNNNENDSPIGVPISRMDLAMWISEEVCCQLLVGGTVQNIVGD